MTTASRRSYLGAAVFAAAAVIATLCILPFVSIGLVRERPVTDVLPLATVAAAAGTSAAFAFWALGRMDWRPRRPVFLLRSAILGVSTVVGSHLLFGLALALFLAIQVAVTPGVILNGDLFVVSIATGAWSFYFLPFTLPLGVAAGMLVEWFERRRAGLDGDQAKAAE